MDLSIFFHMLFSIELMPPERAMVRVGLVVSLAIGALEFMRTWFAFFCF